MGPPAPEPRGVLHAWLTLLQCAVQADRGLPLVLSRGCSSSSLPRYGAPSVVPWKKTRDLMKTHAAPQLNNSWAEGTDALEMLSL